jgi:uncharacterized protein
MTDNLPAPPFHRRRPVASVVLALGVLLGVVYAGLYAMASTLWPNPPLDHSDVTEPRFHEGLAAYYDGDYKSAMDIWLPMAEAGNPTAQFRVGRLHSFGEGVPTNEGTAAKWYQLAAEQEQMHAQFGLGYLYYFGYGVPKDRDRSEYC